MSSTGQEHGNPKLSQVPYTSQEAVAKIFQQFSQMANSLTRFSIQLESIQDSAKHISIEFHALAFQIRTARNAFGSDHSNHGGGGGGNHRGGIYGHGAHLRGGNERSDSDILTHFAFRENAKISIRKQIAARNNVKDPTLNDDEILADYVTMLKKKSDASTKFYNEEKAKRDTPGPSGLTKDEAEHVEHLKKKAEWTKKYKEKDSTKRAADTEGLADHIAYLKKKAEWAKKAKAAETDAEKKAIDDAGYADHLEYMQKKVAWSAKYKKAKAQEDAASGTDEGYADHVEYLKKKVLWSEKYKRSKTAAEIRVDENKGYTEYKKYQELRQRFAKYYRSQKPVKDARDAEDQASYRENFFNRMKWAKALRAEQNRGYTRVSSDGTSPEQDDIKEYRAYLDKKKTWYEDYRAATKPERDKEEEKRNAENLEKYNAFLKTKSEAYDSFQEGREALKTKKRAEETQDRKDKKEANPLGKKYQKYKDKKNIKDYTEDQTTYASTLNAYVEYLVAKEVEYREHQKRMEAIKGAEQDRMDKERKKDPEAKEIKRKYQEHTDIDQSVGLEGVEEAYRKPLRAYTNYLAEKENVTIAHKAAMEKIKGPKGTPEEEALRTRRTAKKKKAEDAYQEKTKGMTDAEKDKVKPPEDVSYYIKSLEDYRDFLLDKLALKEWYLQASAYLDKKDKEAQHLKYEEGGKFKEQQRENADDRRNLLDPRHVNLRTEMGTYHSAPFKPTDYSGMPGAPLSIQETRDKSTTEKDASIYQIQTIADLTNKAQLMGDIETLGHKSAPDINNNKDYHQLAAVAQVAMSLKEKDESGELKDVIPPLNVFVDVKEDTHQYSDKDKFQSFNQAHAEAEVIDSEIFEEVVAKLDELAKSGKVGKVSPKMAATLIDDFKERATAARPDAVVGTKGTFEDKIGKSSDKDPVKDAIHLAIGAGSKGTKIDIDAKFAALIKEDRKLNGTSLLQKNLSAIAIKLANESIKAAGKNLTAQKEAKKNLADIEKSVASDGGKTKFTIEVYEQYLKDDAKENKKKLKTSGSLHDASTDTEVQQQITAAFGKLAQELANAAKAEPSKHTDPATQEPTKQKDTQASPEDFAAKLSKLMQSITSTANKGKDISGLVSTIFGSATKDTAKLGLGYDESDEKNKPTFAGNKGSNEYKEGVTNLLAEFSKILGIDVFKLFDKITVTQAGSIKKAGHPEYEGRVTKKGEGENLKQTLELAIPINGVLGNDAEAKAKVIALLIEEGIFHGLSNKVPGLFENMSAAMVNQIKGSLREVAGISKKDMDEGTKPGKYLSNNEELFAALLKAMSGQDVKPLLNKDAPEDGSQYALSLKGILQTVLAPAILAGAMGSGMIEETAQAAPLPIPNNPASNQVEQQLVVKKVAAKKELITEEGKAEKLKSTIEIKKSLDAKGKSVYGNAERAADEKNYQIIIKKVEKLTAALKVLQDALDAIRHVGPPQMLRPGADAAFNTAFRPPIHELVGPTVSDKSTVNTTPASNQQVSKPKPVRVGDSKPISKPAPSYSKVPFTMDEERTPDADTIWIKELLQSLRLENINSPEVAHKAHGKHFDQPGGREAREFTLNFLRGKTLVAKIRQDESGGNEQGANNYGRLIGDILANEKSLIEALVEAGHAHASDVPGNEKLVALQAQAASQKKGVWGLKGGTRVSPSKWSRMSHQDQLTIVQKHEQNKEEDKDKPPENEVSEPPASPKKGGGTLAKLLAFAIAAGAGTGITAVGGYFNRRKKRREEREAKGFALGGEVKQQFSTEDPVNYEASGTDTIPAMLGWKEFVMNADATAEHKETLNAWNQGREVEPNAEDSPTSTGIEFSGKLTKPVKYLAAGSSTGSRVPLVRRNMTQGDSDAYENLDIPRALLETLAAQKQLLSNHGQNLDTLESRGGLGVEEILATLLNTDVTSNKFRSATSTPDAKGRETKNPALIRQMLDEIVAQHMDVTPQEVNPDYKEIKKSGLLAAQLTPRRGLPDVDPITKEKSNQQEIEERRQSEPQPENSVPFPFNFNGKGSRAGTFIISGKQVDTKFIAACENVKKQAEEMLEKVMDRIAKLKVQFPDLEEIENGSKEFIYDTDTGVETKDSAQFRSALTKKAKLEENIKDQDYNIGERRDNAPQNTWVIEAENSDDASKQFVDAGFISGIFNKYIPKDEDKSKDEKIKIAADRINKGGGTGTSEMDLWIQEVRKEFTPEVDALVESFAAVKKAAKEAEAAWQAETKRLLAAEAAAQKSEIEAANIDRKKTPEMRTEEFIENRNKEKEAAGETAFYGTTEDNVPRPKSETDALGIKEDRFVYTGQGRQPAKDLDADKQDELQKAKDRIKDAKEKHTAALEEREVRKKAPDFKWNEIKGLNENVANAKKEGEAANTDYTALVNKHQPIQNVTGTVKADSMDEALAELKRQGIVVEAKHVKLLKLMTVEELKALNIQKKESSLDITKNAAEAQQVNTTRTLGKFQEEVPVSWGEALSQTMLRITGGAGEVADFKTSEIVPDETKEPVENLNRYRFIARDKDNLEVEDSVEAKDEDEASEKILAMGFTLTELGRGREIKTDKQEAETVNLDKAFLSGVAIFGAGITSAIVGAFVGGPIGAFLGGLAGMNAVSALINPGKEEPLQQHTASAPTVVTVPADSKEPDKDPRPIDTSTHKALGGIAGKSGSFESAVRSKKTPVVSGSPAGADTTPLINKKSGDTVWIDNKEMIVPVNKIKEVIEGVGMLRSSRRSMGGTPVKNGFENAFKEQGGYSRHSGGRNFSNFSAPAPEVRASSSGGSSGDPFLILKQKMNDFIGNTKFGAFTNNLAEASSKIQNFSQSLLGMVGAASPDLLATFSGSLKMLASAIGGQLIPVFLRASAYIQQLSNEVLSGTGWLGQFIGMLTSVCNSFLDGWVLKTVVVLGLLGAGVGTVIAFLGMVVTSFTTLMGACLMLTGAMRAAAIAALAPKGGPMGALTHPSAVPAAGTPAAILAAKNLAGGTGLINSGNAGVRGSALAGNARAGLGGLGNIGGGVFAGLLGGASELMENSEIKSMGKGENAARTGAQVAAAGGGAWAGAAGGAALGTMIFPGVGTVIGGFIGGTLGGILGSKAATAGSNAAFGDKRRNEKDVAAEKEKKNTTNNLAMSYNSVKAQSSFSSVEEAYKKIQVSALGDDPQTAELKKLNEFHMVNLLRAIENKPLLRMEEPVT